LACTGVNSVLEPEPPKRIDGIVVSKHHTYTTSFTSS